ncbi:MAG: hypothetical protein PHS89_10920 [Syntrophaceticus schinkii]|jgi:hypothetical protein|nr:hypothetical protein [Syntrophaceticus schinkii]
MSELLEGIKDEIARRCSIIDDPSYDPGPQLNKDDFIGAMILFVICAIGIALGYILM